MLMIQDSPDEVWGGQELDYSYHTKASPGSSIEVHMVLRKLVMSTIAGEIASGGWLLCKA